MKSFLSLALFAGVALAQSAQIGLPHAGQKLTKGSDVTVQVQRPVRPLIQPQAQYSRSKKHFNIIPELFDRIYGDGCGYRHRLL